MSNTHAKEDIDQEKNYPPVVTQGSYMKEANCFAAYSSDEEREMKAFVFPAEQDKPSGFYILTGKGLHFYPVYPAIHKSCFEPTDISIAAAKNRYGRYNFVVKFRDAEPYLITYNDLDPAIPLSKWDQKENPRVKVSKFERQQKTVCELKEHEALNPESTKALEAELVARVDQTFKNYKDDLEDKDLTREDFPDDEVGDIVFRAYLRARATQPAQPRPNPRSFMNQLKMCAIDKYKNLKASVNQQLRKFSVYAPNEKPSDQPKKVTP